MRKSIRGINKNKKRVNRVYIFDLGRRRATKREILNINPFNGFEWIFDKKFKRAFQYPKQIRVNIGSF